MQNSITATIALAAFAIVPATPAGAQTQTAFSNAPISVQGFTARSQFMPLAQELADGVAFGADASDVTIAFVNTANVPAKSVTFVVRSGRRTQIIVDKGTFLPGARIVHTFEESAEFGETSSVSVQGATFADGNAWGG